MKCECVLRWDVLPTHQTTHVTAIANDRLRVIRWHLVATCLRVIDGPPPQSAQCATERGKLATMTSTLYMRVE